MRKLGLNSHPLESRYALGWREGEGPFLGARGETPADGGTLSVNYRFFQQSRRLYPQSLWKDFSPAATLSLRSTFSDSWDENPNYSKFDFGAAEELLPREAWNDFCNAIEGALNAGALEKLVPARPVFHSLSTAAVDKLRAELLGRLFAVPQAGSYRFFLHQEESTFFGATPELLFRRREGSIFVPAIAGTRVISEKLSYEQAAAELRASAKEQAEHAFVVEGIMESLRALGLDPYAPDQPEALRSRNLVHLFTPIKADDTALPAEELVRALHPTPAVGGTPKKAALEFLAEHEPWERGLFASPLLFNGPEGEICLVAIRSGLLRPEGLYLFAGAGYVKGSRPEAEWEETARKMDSLRSLLREGK